ncbi:Sir2 family NAD+-dependent deacetylase [Telmatospirillum siberiense]|uniref:NAD-dependent protein deacylase n=1 Tax=Telmatospirillum siberiense TaxID=382514 RepID=A0A2N3PSQ6_9PROT|nr:Sir2 family NAD+-dependent deacetylase [Telmatospirillum siberiense]PKU23438.1 NAD-dependent protein deacylase [Telmatospirillum siberiense]
MGQGSIVILTGAGISKESGLDTFRDADGIWNKVGIEDVATPEGFRRNPALVQSFYNDRRRQLESGEALPNPAHLALARLEEEWDGDVAVVTQNIDDLHERAGSKRVLHMHGELRKGRCQSCNAVFTWSGDMGADSICPSCRKAGALRPHIVWFGEIPLDMPQIFELLDQCGLFLSIGTSGNVYPAAGFVSHLRSKGLARTVELNLEPSQGATMFHETIYGPASQVVPEFVADLLNQG